MASLAQVLKKQRKITPELAHAVTDAFRQGADWATAADKIGCTVWSLHSFANANPDFREAWKDARDAADGIIIRTLFDRARNGDTTAMIFWLKNRKPSEWRDRPDITVNVANFLQSPDWQRIKERLLESLAPYPEALAAVVRALEQDSAK